MAITVRRLVAELGLKLDEKSFKKADSALANLKKAAVGLGAVFVAKKIAQAFAAVINLASDAQETTQQLGALFGDASADIIKDADEMATRLGRSSFDIQKRIGAIGAITKPLLRSGEAAREVATKFSELTIDLASFFNTTEPKALNALRAGLTGEIEPLKKFGVVMSVAALDAFALEEGIGKTVDQMSIAEKTQLRFEFIMRNTTDAQGDAIRTAKGWANISRAVLSVTKDLATRLGSFFFPQVEKSAASVRDLVVNIRDWFKANDALIRSKIEPFLKTLGDLLEAVVGAVIFVADGLQMMAVAAFNLARELSPLADSLDTILIIGIALVAVFGFLPLLMAAFVAFLILLADDLKGFREGKDSLIGRFLKSPINPDDHWLVKVFKAVVKWVDKAFDRVNIFLEGLAEDVVKLGASDAIMELFTTAIAFWKTQFEDFGKFLGEFFSVNVPGFDRLIDFVAGVDRSEDAADRFLTPGAKAQLAFIKRSGGMLGGRRIEPGGATSAAAIARPSVGPTLAEDREATLAINQVLNVNQVINTTPDQSPEEIADIAAEKIRAVQEGQNEIALRQMALRRGTTR